MHACTHAHTRLPTNQPTNQPISAILEKVNRLSAALWIRDKLRRCYWDVPFDTAHFFMVPRDLGQSRSMFCWCLGWVVWVIGGGGCVVHVGSCLKDFVSFSYFKRFWYSFCGETSIIIIIIIIMLICRAPLSHRQSSSGRFTETCA